jgi:hypothetical protein
VTSVEIGDREKNGKQIAGDHRGGMKSGGKRFLGDFRENREQQIKITWLPGDLQPSRRPGAKVWQAMVMSRGVFSKLCGIFPRAGPFCPPYLRAQTRVRPYKKILVVTPGTPN